MALTKNTTTVTNISDLSSTPNETEGLTASQLQAKFDQTGSDLKDYINDTLTVEQDAINASKINITDIVDNLTSTDTNKPLSANQGKVLSAGWLPLGDVTYSSVDDPTGVVTIAEDVTSYLSLGMRLKMTNGGNTIYGIITAISYSSPNTTITFLHEIDPTDSLALHLLQNSAITDVYYSVMKTPYGFPVDVTHWRRTYYDTVYRQLATPTQNAYYNIDSAQLSVPIGLWRLSYNVTLGLVKTGGGSITSDLSTSTTSVSNLKLQGSYDYNLDDYKAIVSLSDVVGLTSKTTYYLITATGTASVSYIRNWGAGINAPTQIIAECAYL